eukprot:1152617-Pelagomonas_calceolata.AAC.7
MKTLDASQRQQDHKLLEATAPFSRAQAKKSSELAGGIMITFSLRTKQAYTSALIHLAAC